MKLREHRHEEPRGQHAGAPPVQDSTMRERAEHLLAASADIIDYALSGDSAAFLAANLQEGGQ